jgi:hypothetical protein
MGNRNDCVVDKGAGQSRSQAEHAGDNERLDPGWCFGGAFRRGTTAVAHDVPVDVEVFRVDGGLARGARDGHATGRRQTRCVDDRVVKLQRGVCWQRWVGRIADITLGTSEVASAQLRKNRALAFRGVLRERRGRIDHLHVGFRGPHPGSYWAIGWRQLSEPGRLTRLLWTRRVCSQLGVVYVFTRRVELRGFQQTRELLVARVRRFEVMDDASERHGGRLLAIVLDGEEVSLSHP